MNTEIRYDGLMFPTFVLSLAKNIDIDLITIILLFLRITILTYNYSLKIYLTSHHFKKCNEIHKSLIILMANYEH